MKNIVNQIPSPLMGEGQGEGELNAEQVNLSGKKTKKTIN